MTKTATTSLAALRREAGLKGPLLSPPESNPKTRKGGKIGIMTWVLHLSPAKESGYEMCPGRSAGCTAACLNFAGNPLYFEAKHAARKRKTVLFVKQRDLFMNILALEIATAIKVAEEAKMEPAFRLNGTSDILWDVKTFKLRPAVAIKAGLPPRADKTTILELFSEVQFYDYTAVLRSTPIPSNYYLVFSEKEDNEDNVAEAMRRGLNIASVFPAKSVPKTHLGRPVIDGDETDARFLDAKDVVVGLKVKGSRGVADATGFTHK